MSPGLPMLEFSREEWMAQFDVIALIGEMKSAPAQAGRHPETRWRSRVGVHVGIRVGPLELERHSHQHLQLHRSAAAVCGTISASLVEDADSTHPRR